MKNISKILFILSVSITFLMANEDDIFNSLQSSIKIVSTSNDNILFNNVNQSSKITDKQKYRVDIGINNNYLISSDILKQGYSGIGFFIEPYITKHFSIRIEYDRWSISSQKIDYYDTPFHNTDVWKKKFLIKVNMYPNHQMIYTQFGIQGTLKKIGTEERGGFYFGLGMRLIKYKNCNIYLTAARNILGNFTLADGVVWDKNNELSIETSYSINWFNKDE